MPRPGPGQTARLTSPSSGYFPLSGTGTNSSYAAFTISTPVTLSGYYGLNGQVSASNTVTITNTGSTTLNFNSFQLFSSNPNAFTTSASCGSVAAGASCQIHVAFQATVSAAGSTMANLIVGEATTGKQQSVAISASYSPSRPSVSPKSYTFPSTAQTTSSTYSFTVTDVNGNPLGHPVTLSGFSGPFSVSPSSCPASTNSFCTYSVTFTPTGTGIFYDYPTVTDTTTGLTAPSVTLQGTGTAAPVTGAPAVMLSPSPLTFANRANNSTSVPTAVTLTNGGSGNAPLTISGISLLGTANGNFSETNNCPSSLATGAYCTISVTFAPTVTGMQSATLQVVSNATSSPNTETVSGTSQ